VTPPSDSEQDCARAAALAIWRRLEGRGFSGWDPYDALNSPRLGGVAGRSRISRRVATQAVKRSPVPLQPILGIAAEPDAYTLGHGLLTLARLAEGSALPSPATSAKKIIDQLRGMMVREWRTNAWGYHFPVHTRFFSYAPPTPNLISTAFVAKGLAAVTRVGIADCGEELRGCAGFILETLPRTANTSGQCFGYLPGESTVVHNANMLAAMVLCETADICGEAAWVEEALSCARFTAARQSADGSWPYSEEGYGRWVDGFHTGFVLEGLARVVRATRDTALERSLQRGVRFYVAQLFGPAGEPKYYPHRAYPLDALSAAQGLETLHVALGGAAAQAVPAQLGWALKHLVRPDGRVAYQVHRGWTDWREFPRWSSAPLMSALAGVAAREGAT